MKIAKIGVLFLSMTVLMTSAFLTQNAFAGIGDCPYGADPKTGICWCGPPNGVAGATLPPAICIERPSAVGGDLISLDTTMVLVAGAQYTMAWMIPVLVAAAGIGIVVARKI